MPLSEQTLGIISTTAGAVDAEGIHTTATFGRVVDLLAERARRVVLSVPIQAPNEALDHVLRASNVELIPQPGYSSLLQALPHPIRIIGAYARVCARSDCIFIRGVLPYVAHFYAFARWYGRKPCQWLIGNPTALARSHRRAGRVKDMFSYLYAWQNQVWTQLGRRLTGGSFVCCGDELGQLFASPRTYSTVSSAITEADIWERADTCQGETVEVLFIGIPRPEKGLQYLLEALASLRTDRRWHLTIVGGTSRYADHQRGLAELAVRLGITERVAWVGFVPFGPQLFAYLRKADVFVLPSVSEGTPHVITEAHANSVPVVTTNVGGIPTSVSDGQNGLLVPAKDPGALARAIERVISEGELRRRLIANGLRSARATTVNRFVDVVAGCL